MPTDSPMPSPDINAPSPSTSSVSIEDLNIHNINYDTVLNSDKYNMINSSIENSINDTDIYVPTTVINNIKSYITPDTCTTVQGMSNYIFLIVKFFFFLIFDYYLELYDPASVSFPAMENQDQQSLTSHFPYDAPSPPPDETFAYSAFPNQTNVSYTNDVRKSFIYCTTICIIIFVLQMNNHNKSSTYSTSSYESYIPTPMSSSQQFLSTEFSNNMIHPTNSSSLINENTIPVSHVPQTGNLN